jgi:hypothetical protein
MILLPGYSDEDVRVKKITEALHKFTVMYPQQKVYLHTDKKEYNAGDIMWLKAYIVNGLDHLPDTFSTNLYVELISPFQTRVEIKRLRMFHGFGIGDIGYRYPSRRIVPWEHLHHGCRILIRNSILKRISRY